MNLLPLQKTERRGRYPKHTFQTKEMAFTAQPFCIAPVLPGETMQSVLLEARVVSAPVRSSIVGWKKQYFFFYVRVTDLINDAIRDMFVDPANVDLSATLGVAANSTPFYTAKGGVDYLSRSVTRIVDTYFRDDGEVAADFVTSEGVPIVQIRESSWMDSLTDKDDMPEGAAIASATDAGDLERLMIAFEQLRALGLQDMTYEDWLRSYGIAIPRKDENKPELLHTFSDWQYPSNTIDPTNGTPRSALSWVFKNSARDRKMFKEPGFVVGISVTRPKVYFSGLAGNLSAHLTRAWDWSPNYLGQFPEATLKNFATDTGPLGDTLAAPDGYYVDMRDLFTSGDQFQNVLPFPASGANPVNDGAYNMLALPPRTSFRWKYPSEIMCKSFFVDSGGTNFHVRADGYVSFGIQGTLADHTVGNMAEA